LVGEPGSGARHSHAHTSDEHADPAYQHAPSTYCNEHCHPGTADGYQYPGSYRHKHRYTGAGHGYSSATHCHEHGDPNIQDIRDGVWKTYNSERGTLYRAGPRPH
jgi:hypothetical protein